MSVHDLIADATNVVQALAILAGGFWAYYKFFRGRTFARRAQVDLDCELLSDTKHLAARVGISFRNTGLSDIPLRLKVLWVYTATDADWADGPKWEQVALVPVLSDNDWLEGGDVVTDDVLVPLPIAGPKTVVAYRARCAIYEQRRKPGAGYWAAEAIIPAGALTSKGSRKAVREEVPQ